MRLSRACARARECKCKSIRWFDDPGTRSNGAHKVRRKFSDIDKTFAVTKPTVLRVSRCIRWQSGTDSASAPSLFAEVVIKYRNALARGKIGESRYR